MGRLLRAATVLGIGGLLLALGGVGGGGPAAAESPTDPERDVVLGLIVSKASPTASNRSLAATMSGAGAEVATSRSITPTLGVIDFERPLTFAEAAPIVAAVEARPDVIAVGPNRRVFAAEAPFIPNDPYFSQQWDMWDGATPTDYGTRAAQLWGATRGSASVIVGVVDTGSTSHPDLAGTTVPGFDFIEDPSSARDGNGWDFDPSDEGTWCPSDGERSSWHGTHVHGTVNAIQDNGIGVTGLAPNVKVQHLRVLGECGAGTGADILSAVIWGSGGALSDWWDPVPSQNPGMNPTPASVLNLSLGGTGACDAVSQQIFDQARARGTTIVVAAGNDTVSAGGEWPGNCNNVINVASSNRSGFLSPFSNYGTAPGQIDLSAPGSTIVSTFNSGDTVPAVPTYAALNGTSMSAPHVAAAAAILYSLGITRPSDVEAALRSSVRPFAPGSGCDVVRCGSGILDASQLANYLPVSDPGAPTAVTAIAGDRQVSVSWTPPASTGGAPLVSATATASPGGQSCTTTSTSCVITGLDNGTAYRVFVTVTNSAGRTGPAGTSDTVTPVAPTVVPGAPTGVAAQAVDSTTARVQWTAPVSDGGSPLTGYVVTASRDGQAFSEVRRTTATATTVDVTGLVAGATYAFQVAAVNSLGQGSWSASSAPITLPAVVVTPPGQVSGFTTGRFVKTGNRYRVTVRWQPPADDGGAPVTGYRARLGLSGRWTSWSSLDSAAALLNDLRRGTRYSLQVRAVNEAGAGPLKTYSVRTPAG